MSDVVGLLGSNLQDLKTYENQTSVRNWISLQLQSELNNLNISLTGGKATADTTTAAPTIASNTTLNAAAATTGNITTASPTANTTSAATGELPYTLQSRAPAILIRFYFNKFSLCFGLPSTLRQRKCMLLFFLINAVFASQCRLLLSKIQYSDTY